MRDCRNWRPFAILFLYFCLCVVRGSDSDLSTERTLLDPQISDLNQQTIVPDHNVATTSFENTADSTKVSSLSKQKRCNRGQLGATLTSRQNLPSDINLIPKTLDASQIAKNLCIQCISLNKCKTAEGCKACSLLCKDVVLLKDQPKASDAPDVECANPTTTQGDGGPVVENAASSEGVKEVADAEQNLTTSDGPILGSRAGFGDEGACGGHLLATVTTGNVKDMILQMVGVEDTTDILSISVRATTRLGTAPVAKGPEGPEALLTIFKDELTKAILAENVHTGMLEPPTMHELFFRVLEMVQNSKPDVNHVGATHAEESPSQSENEHEHPLNDSLESRVITDSQNERLGSNQVGPLHTEKTAAVKMPEDNVQLDAHPLFREEDESFLPRDSENSRQTGHAGSGETKNLSEAHMLEGKEEELEKHSSTGKHGVHTDGISSTDSIKSSLRQTQEDEELHKEHKVLLPQGEEIDQQSDRLGATHEQESSPRQMEETDDDILPRFPLAEKPEGFVIPQLANPAIIEGPPLPGMVLGATHKENQTSGVTNEMQNGSPNNRPMEAVDSTEEDLPRHNLADHEGSLVLQVSNISTIGLSSPIGNGVDDSFIPDMEAEASEQNLVSVTDKDQPTEGMSRFEAEIVNVPKINGTTLGDNAKVEAKMSPKQALNSVENDGTSEAILGAIPATESKDANNKSLSEISLNGIGDSTLNMSKKLPESIIKAAEGEQDMVANMKTENSKPETFDVKGILLDTLSRLDSTELTPLETVRAHSVNENVDSRPNQENLSNGMFDIDGSAIEAAERGNQAGSRLESISDNSIKNSIEMATNETEFQEVLPVETIFGSVGNSNMPTEEDKLLDVIPVSPNQEKGITDTMDHESSQKMSLSVSKQNTSEIGDKIMPDEEITTSNNQSLDTTGIMIPDPEMTNDLKPSPGDIIASAAHGNDWNKLVGPLKHTEEGQTKGSMSTTGPNSPATEMQGNEMIDFNENLNRLKMGQSSASGIVEGAAPETATDAEVTNAKNHFLGSTAENREASSEPMISSAVENTMEAKNLEKADLGTVSDVSNIKNPTGDSVLQDLETGVQAHASQSGILEEVSLNTLKGISETETMFQVPPGKMVEKSLEISMPEDLSNTQLKEASETMSFDTAGGSADRISPTETFVGSPLDNRNEIPTADKPAMFSSMTTAGSEFEIKPGESTIAKQTPGTVDARSLSPIGDTLGEAPLPDLSDVEAPNSQSIAGASATDVFLTQNLTITRTEDHTMENKTSRLSSSSSTSSVTEDKLEDGNDMVAESSENRVMNVVVPDEFLGWSKPSDNPTTINIVIPPKAIPQESANIEKADLREEEPEDEPGDHGEFAEPETMDGDEETDNREAGGDEDFEEENQVRESDNEQGRNTNINSRNRDFDEHPEIETQLRESDNEGPQDDEEQILEDDSPNDIDREENEEEAAKVRESDTDDNDNGERGQTLKENEEEAPEVRESDTENEEGDIDSDRRTSIGIKQPQSFSRLKKLMHSMQSPQERIASAIRKAKDRSNVGAEAPLLTEEGDSTFPKKVLKTESKIGKMLEKFRDRLHKNKADVGANTVSSSARENFSHQNANTFKNSDNSDTFDEDEIGLENEQRLSKQQHSHDQDDDSRLEEPHNQEVVHTTYKSPDLKLPFRNPPRLGNGRLSSDSQLKISEDHLTVDPPRSTPSQLDRQRIFKDSQSHSQLQERMNVVNDPPLDFAPGEDPTLQEPDRELALSGINQNDLVPTTRSSIFGDHFPSTPSLSEIISSAKDKFRKTFEESTRTLDSSSRPAVGSANQRTTPGLDRILGDSTSTSGISSSNIQSPDEVRTFQQGQVLGDSSTGNGGNPVNQGLGSIDGASVRHTIQEIGQNTGRVIQETTNILGDTIRNGKQGIEKIFRGVNDLASRSNGEGLGNPDPATLRYKLPTSGITDTLSQSFNRNSIGDLDGARKAISDTSPTKSALDNIGFPRANLNRFGQLNLDTANQDDLSGIGLTPHVTAQPIGKFNLNKFDDTGLSSPVTLQAQGRQPSEGSSGFTGLTLPAVNRIDSLGNLKPITVSEIDVKDPTNVDNLHPLGSQSELIVEPPGLDTSDSSEEGLKVDQTGLPKQQTDSAVNQKQPVVTEGLPRIGNFDVHTPFSIPRNMMTKPTANPISNFEAAKNALLKLQQLTGRLRKKDGTGKKSSATSEEQPSVTDVVKVLQEISKEVISTAENVSKSKSKNVQSTEPNIVGSQILENSWENLQPFLPRDSHPLTITKPTFPHKHHLVGIFPSTTLKTPLDTSGTTPAFQKLLDRTSTYYTTPSAARADNNIQMAVKPINNQFGNNGRSSTPLPALINNKIKEQHQINNLGPVQSAVTVSPLPSRFANDDTIGMVQSNHQANRPIPFGLNRELPQSINEMLTPKPGEGILPVKASITPSQGSGAIDTAKLPSVGAGEPVQIPSISGDLSSSTMSSSSSDRVESRQPATKNIEDESSPVLAARHQNDIAISADTPRDIYFVGTGMKLPLQMVKKEGGEVHLSVDIDKLCSCKNNSSCAKNQSADGSELKKDLVLDGSSSNSVEKSAGDGFAKRNVPTHRSLRDVEDRYAVEWEVGEPEEVRHSADTDDTIGEHRIEIEIDDPVIIPLSSSSHTQEASNVRIVNRFSASTDEGIKTPIGSPHMTTLSNESNSNSDTDRNTIKKISDKVLSNHAVDVVMELPKAIQDEKNGTANIYKGEDLPMKKASPYGNTDQTNLTKLNVKKAENYQYSSPFRRLHYPELGSKKSLDSTESVPSSIEKSTYLSNLLKKLRSRLPTQEPRTVNTNLRSMSNLFSHRTRNQQVESDEGHKLTKLSNRFKDLNVDRYSNLALRNRLFPTLGRKKEPLAKLEKSADDEKEVLPVEDQDKEDQGGGIVKNVFAWFKNLNNKQKR